MVHLIALVALLAAGGGAASPAACKRTTADFGAWLKAAVAAIAEGPSFPSRLGVHLVSFDGTPPETTPLVELAPGKIAVNGRPPGDEPGIVPLTEQLAALQKDLAQLAQTYKLLYPGRKPDRITVAVDRDVVWSEVVALADAVTAAGFTHVDWVFAIKRKIAVAPPRRSSADEQLAAIRASNDPSVKAAKLAELMTRVLDRCPQMLKALGALAGFDPAMKPAILAEGAPTALAACHCAVDIDALKTLLYATLAPGDGDPYSVVSLSVAPAKGGDARPLTAAPTARWSATYKQIVDAARARGATSYRLAAP